MTIGELAARLRVTPRALRHYESIGLLRPDLVDARTGYRSYGAAALLRGIQVEQLKAAGLALQDVIAVLDGDDSAVAALVRRRRAVEQALANGARELATIDSLLGAAATLAAPSVVEHEPGHAVVRSFRCRQDEVGRTIRTAVQRLRRDLRGTDSSLRCRSFSARFPIDIDDTDATPLEVAAHLDGPHAGSQVLRARREMRVELVGELGLLPLAYDVALSAVHARGLEPTGDVVEHYVDIGRVPRTIVAIPLR